MSSAFDRENHHYFTTPFNGLLALEIYIRTELQNSNTRVELPHFGVMADYIPNYNKTARKSVLDVSHVQVLVIEYNGDDSSALLTVLAYLT